MGKNRFAAGIVMVPCLLLSAAFFSTAVWGDVPGENQSLALGLGGLLLAAGLLALLIPSTNRSDGSSLLGRTEELVLRRSGY